MYAYRVRALLVIPKDLRDVGLLVGLRLFVFPLLPVIIGVIPFLLPSLLGVKRVAFVCALDDGQGFLHALARVVVGKDFSRFVGELLEVLLYEYTFVYLLVASSVKQINFALRQLCGKNVFV